LRNINRPEFPQSKLPPSLSITTIPPFGGVARKKIELGRSLEIYRNQTILMRS
jgi:hypothetical protein